MSPGPGGSSRTSMRTIRTWSERGVIFSKPTASRRTPTTSRAPASRVPHPEVAARVSLDSYAISGLRTGQVEFLCAPDHLCPTHDYGVTFERATAVSYADRRHIFISGTASIDHEGRILHPGNVIGQLDRTLENIEALLAKAGANLGDLASILVYLRDPAEGALVEAALVERIGRGSFCVGERPCVSPRLVD